MFVDSVSVRDDAALGGHDGAGVQFNRHLGFKVGFRHIFKDNFSIRELQCFTVPNAHCTVATYKGCVIRDTF